MGIREIYEGYVKNGDETGIMTLIESLAEDEILLIKLTEMIERYKQIV